MKFFITIVAIMSFNVFAQNAGPTNCLDYINQRALDGSNDFFQLDSSFNIVGKEKYPVYESGNTHKGLFRKVDGTFEKIGNKDPFYEVEIYKDKDGFVNKITYKTSKIGGKGEIEFKKGADGTCYPSDREQAVSGPNKSFNTELCRKIKDFWAKNPQFAVCNSKEAIDAGKSLQDDLKKYGQDSGCKFCNVGDWNSSSIKTVASHPFVKSVSILSSCDAQGVSSFVNNDALWAQSNVMIEVKPEQMPKADQE